MRGLARHPNSQLNASKRPLGTILGTAKSPKKVSSCLTFLNTPARWISKLPPGRKVRCYRRERANRAVTTGLQTVGQKLQRASVFGPSRMFLASSVSESFVFVCTLLRHHGVTRFSSARFHCFSTVLGDGIRSRPPGRKVNECYGDVTPTIGVIRPSPGKSKLQASQLACGLTRL